MNDPMRRMLNDVFSSPLFTRPLLTPISPMVAERIREQEREQDKADHLSEALNDEIYFRTINEDWEIVDYGQLMRALRNLDSAIRGEEAGRDAVFTALSIIQRRLKQAIADEVEA